MIKKRSKYGVSEIIGTLTLLIIAVAVISLVYLTVITNLEPPNNRNVEIIGKMEGGAAILEHRGGDSLEMDTRIIFTVGGHDISYDLSNITLDLLQSDGSDGKTDNYWDIGEKLYYFDPNWYPNNIWTPAAITPRIEIKITDPLSNKLVMLGTLKEGFLGYGGIWHFDECNGNTTEDAMEHFNTGYLGKYPSWVSPVDKFKPIWLNEIGGAKKNCSLSFDGINDFVYVIDTWSLDIPINLTIESWFKYYGGDNIISSQFFDGQFGYVPRLTSVNNDIYGIVYRNGAPFSSDCVLKILNVSDEGSIEDANVDDTIVNGDCYEPDIVKLTNNSIAVAFSDDLNGNGIIKTYNISDDGIITYTNNMKTFSNYCSELRIVQVNDTVYALVHGGADGIIKTFDININGEISYINNYTFDTTECFDPDIVHVSNNTFVIAYGYGNNKNWFIKTFNITNDGTIIDNNSPFLIDNDCDDPCLVRVSNNTFALVYELMQDSEGVIKTYRLLSDGDISHTVSSVKFETTKPSGPSPIQCHDPYIAHLYNNIYMVAYEGPVSHTGSTSRFNITSNGGITIISNITYSEAHGFEPFILKISEYVYNIVYRDKSPHPGNITSFRIYDDGVDDPSAYHRGVNKRGSYGIFVNSTYVFGLINNYLVFDDISSPEEWNHVAMSYDGENIRLYLNGIETPSSPFPYTQEITQTSNPLIFGFQYLGYIDEIAIYGKILTLTDIQDHYNNPGSLPINP